MEYNEKYILFIDVLGFKKYIDETVDKDKTNIVKTQSFYNLMKSLRHDLAMDYEKRNFELQILKKNYFFNDAVITQFSDSIIISYKIKKGCFKRLLQDTNHIFLTGVYFGFIFRGAITKGKIVHESDIVFGPGFIKAYQFESCTAKYPRIVIDKEVVSENIDNDDELVKKLLKKDKKDNQFYVDIFSGLSERYKNDKSIRMSMGHIYQIFSEGLESSDISIKEKYMWLKEKYEEFLCSYKNFDYDMKCNV